MEKIDKSRFTWVGADPEKREGIARPSVTYWQDAIGRLRRNPVAMVCLVIILLIILSTSKDQVLVYDPEGEYEPLVQALGGVSLPICAGSDIHLNERLLYLGLS